MDARKSYDRFSTAPVLNERGQPIIASLEGRTPAVFKALAEHNTLTIYDLHAIVGGDLRSLRRLLTILKAKPNEYTRILPEQVRTRTLRQALYHQLAPRGVEWLNANGHRVAQPKRVYNLGHTGLVSHIMSSLQAGIAQTDARFVSWEELQEHPKFPPETRRVKDNTAIPHPKEGTVRPDTHPFGIEISGKYRFFVVEADNGTESIQTRLREKFEAYLDFIRRKGFHARYGLPNYSVIFVFTNPVRLTNAMTELASMGGSAFILFTLADQTKPAGYLFTQPCERVGFPILQLNEP